MAINRSSKHNFSLQITVRFFNVSSEYSVAHQVIPPPTIDDFNSLLFSPICSTKYHEIVRSRPAFLSIRFHPLTVFVDVFSPIVN